MNNSEEFLIAGLSGWQPMCSPTYFGHPSYVLLNETNREIIQPVIDGFRYNVRKIKYTRPDLLKQRQYENCSWNKIPNNILIEWKEILGV